MIDSKWAGKSAIVTGAGTGLGKAAAIALTAAGVRVIVCGRRLHKVQETAAEIAQAGGTAAAVRADVRIEEDTHRLVNECLERFGRVDILVNNAAVFEPGDVAQTTLQAWNDQLAVNLTGAFLMAKAAIPAMRANKYGCIVNVTSAMAENGAGGYAAYGASKAGLESLTRTIADEERDNGISAHTFDPGTIRSEMHATGRDPALVAPALLELIALQA